MITLTRVMPQDLTEEDVRWLTIGCMACCWRKFLPVELVERAIAGDLGFYRIEGTGRGMVAVARIENAMIIECVAGRSLLRKFEEIYYELKVLARSLGLTKLSGLVSRPGLKHIYDTKTQAKPVAEFYVEQL